MPWLHIVAEPFVIRVLQCRVHQECLRDEDQTADPRSYDSDLEPRGPGYRARGEFRNEQLNRGSALQGV
jgi:hypothetical protein